MKIAGKVIDHYDALLLIIVALWFVVGLYNLDVKSFSTDEAYSLYLSKLPIGDMLRTTASDVHPPLYYLLLHGWVNLSGDSDFSVRFLSVVFGAGALVMTYFLGCALFDKGVGAISALLFSVSAFELQVSQNARMYSLMALLVCASMYFFIRYIRQRGLTASIGYVLTTTLLLYTHVYALFFVLAQNVFLITIVLIESREIRPRFVSWFAMQGLVLLLFAPWVYALSHQVLRVEQGAVTGAVAPTLINFIFTFYSFAGASRILTAIFAVLVCLAILVYKGHDVTTFFRDITSISSFKRTIGFKNVNEAYFLLLWLFIPVIAPFGISLVSVSIFFFRYASAAAIALFILVAAGIKGIGHTGTKIGVLCIVILLSLASIQASIVSPDPQPFKLVTHDLDASAKSGDLILVFPGSLLPLGIAHYNTRTDINMSEVGQANLRQVSQDDIQKLILDVNSHDRVYFVQLVVPAFEIENYTLVKNTLLTLYNVSYYQRYGIFEVYLLTR
jgi:4-amino-4-deoxy-L-arabinose transferase-like glycosyltransferase